MRRQPEQTGLPSVWGQRRRRNTFSTPLSDMCMIRTMLRERAAAESRKCCTMTARWKRTNQLLFSQSQQIKYKSDSPGGS
jgi:hypothetical protein